MLFSSKGHWLFLLKSILISRTVLIATIRRPTARDKDLSGWEGASRCIVLYFTIINGGETVAISEGT